MSDIAPEGQKPPVQPYVAYPRQQQYRDADRLQALMEGFFGLNLVFLINVLLVFGINLGIGVGGTRVLLLAVPVMLVVISIASYPHNRKIAFGRGWQQGSAVLASVLIGLNSALCCGVIGYGVMQSIAMAEMKKYGVRYSLFLRKRDIEKVIDELRAQPRVPPPATP